MNIDFLLKEDGGGITLDWVVLSAIVITLGGSVTAILVTGDTPLGTTVAGMLDGAMKD